MREYRVIGKPFEVTGVDGADYIGDRLVPVLVDTTASQRARLGFDEGAYQHALRSARKADLTLGEPLFAYEDFGTPVLLRLSDGWITSSPLAVGPELDAVVPGATAAFEEAATELERRDLATLESSNFALDSLPSRRDLASLLEDWVEDRIAAAQSAAISWVMTDKEAEAASRQLRREYDRIVAEYSPELRESLADVLAAARASRDEPGPENPPLSRTMPAPSHSAFDAARAIPQGRER